MPRRYRFLAILFVLPLLIILGLFNVLGRETIGTRHRGGRRVRTFRFYQGVKAATNGLSTKGRPTKVCLLSS